MQLAVIPLKWLDCIETFPKSRWAGGPAAGDSPANDPSLVGEWAVVRNRTPVAEKQL